jgi:succinate dehydrogenase / fumarate reductase cytochrome b subunit
MNTEKTQNNYSVIGRKLFLGFSGLVLLMFIVGHLLGNLTFFLGRDAINNYAYFLHHNKALVYTARVVLLINLITHLYFSITITLINNAAKDVNYIVNRNMKTTFAAKTMIFSGLFILLFLIYHLCHFTFGWIDADFYGVYDSKNRLDVYGYVYHSFSNVFISLFYLSSLVCLGLHLSHAFFSVCQTFSITNSTQSISNVQKKGKILGGLLALCYMSIPLSVFLKII